MPRPDPNGAITLFAPGLRTFSQTAPSMQLTAAGVRFFLNISSISGTGAALQVSVEMVDPLSRNGIVLAKWQFAAHGGAGTWELTIYPGIDESANQAVSDCLQGDLLVTAFVFGDTPQVNFSLCAIPIE